MNTEWRIIDGKSYVTITDQDYRGTMVFNESTSRQLQTIYEAFTQLSSETQRQKVEIEDLRARLAKAEATVQFEQSNLKHQSQRMADLRAKLKEYEDAPTIASVIANYNDESAWNQIVQECYESELPPVGTELIARLVDTPKKLM